MPRDGSGEYRYPAGTEGASGGTIESEKYNAYILDVQEDANTVRPVLYGGTGASTVAAARTALGVMPTTGGTLTGDITVNKADPLIQLKKTASGQTAWLGASTGELDRWWFALGDATAETGGNAGSNFVLTRWNDAGAQISPEALNINRATGAWTIGGALSCGAITCGAITPHSVNAPNHGSFGYDVTVTRAAIGTPGHGYVFLGNSTTRYIGYDGTNYVMPGAGVYIGGAVNASGNITGGSFTTAGAATVSGTLTASQISAPGGLTVGGAATISGLIYGANNLSVEGPNIHVGAVLTLGKILFGTGGQNLNFNVTNSDGWRLQGGGGGFHIDTNAVKPGGGTWDAPSDARIKTLLGEYDHGLAQIRSLKPQRFKYKDKGFDLVKDREFIGLVAQDVEPVMPEMVSKKKGHIDGKEVKDLRMTDTSALIYALVNACRELAERVEQLEGNGTAKRKR